MRSSRHKFAKRCFQVYLNFTLSLIRYTPSSYALFSMHLVLLAAQFFVGYFLLDTVYFIVRLCANNRSSYYIRCSL